METLTRTEISSYDELCNCGPVTTERALEIAMSRFDRSVTRHEIEQMADAVASCATFEQMIRAHAQRSARFQYTPDLLVRLIHRNFNATPAKSFRTILDVFLPLGPKRLHEMLDLLLHGVADGTLLEVLRTSLPGELTNEQHLFFFALSRKSKKRGYAVLWERDDFLRLEICKNRDLTDVERSTANVLAGAWEGTSASLLDTSRALAAAMLTR